MESNKKNRLRREICLKLTIKTPKENRKNKNIKKQTQIQCPQENN